MKNPVKLEQDRLVIDMDAIIDGMTPGRQKEFYQRVAFQDALILNLCEHVATGGVEVETETNTDTWELSHQTVEKCQRALLPRMPEVVQHLVARLVYERDTSVDQRSKYQMKLWDLREAWPRGTQPPADDYQPSWAVKKLTADQVAKLIDVFEREQNGQKIEFLQLPPAAIDFDDFDDEIKARAEHEARLARIEDATQGVTVKLAANKPDVTTVVSEEGDWEAIYINGEMIAEGHSLSTRQVLDAVGIENKRIQVYINPYAGSLPKKLSELRQN